MLYPIGMAYDIMIGKDIFSIVVITVVNLDYFEYRRDDVKKKSYFYPTVT